jgi:hypothetical protein
MNNGTYESLPAHGLLAPEGFKRGLFLNTILFTAVAVISLATTVQAAELPEAPSSVIRANAPVIDAPTRVSVPQIGEVGPVDAKFVSLALISTTSTFADSYTTLFARQNWLARRPGVCNVEVQSPYLYGTHPTVGRAYAVASAKSAGSVFAAYYLRKHHNRFWSLPLFANTAISLQGVTQNMIACN